MAYMDPMGIYLGSRGCLLDFDSKTRRKTKLEERYGSDHHDG